MSAAPGWHALRSCRTCEAAVTARSSTSARPRCGKERPGSCITCRPKPPSSALPEALAREVGDDGICVNMLCPDYIPDAEMLRAEPDRDAFVISQRVLKRTEGPDDMLGALAFLAGPGSDFVTGQSLLVNGGVAFN